MCAAFQDKEEAYGNMERETHENFKIEPPQGEERREGEEGDWKGDLAREQEGFILNIVKV
jgi:hypothetical protein